VDGLPSLMEDEEPEWEASSNDENSSDDEDGEGADR
jgi:hypothetical protein